MTDAELRDAAVAKLKLTTVGFNNKYWVTPPQGTNWDQALDYLSLIGGTDSPPTGGKLKWKPPVLDNPVVWNLDNSSRSLIAAGQGRPLRINQTGVVDSGVLRELDGWHDIEWIGGDCNITSGSDLMAIPFRNCSGTIHLEGLNLRGSSVADYIVARYGNETVWHIQNCRIENNDIGGEHADLFQSQQGRIGFLGFYQCTLVVEYQGIFLRNATASSYIRGGELTRVNFRRKGGTASPSTYLWLTDEDPETGGPTIGNFNVSDVWAEDTGDTGMDIYPNRGFGKFAVNGAAVNKEGNFVLSDAQGRYIRPSKPNDLVPPGGPYSGQGAEDAGWTGSIRIGVPPGGDFVPASVPGLNYTSPGYA